MDTDKDTSRVMTFRRGVEQIPIHLRRRLGKHRRVGERA